MKKGSRKQRIHGDTKATMVQAAKDCELALDKYHRLVHGRKLMFRPSTVATLLDLQVRTIHEWIRTGRFPSVQIGRTRWVTRRQLEQWLEHISANYAHGFDIDVDTSPQTPDDFDPNEVTDEGPK